ncbi:hypothetical protein [Gemmiger formicilis]|uniref:hypothetical protein n=1 Tax=Gemmiger formicilis TaxID=745368 RepID=UPI0035201375
MKNRIISSKIELRFREVRLEGCPPRSPVQQALISAAQQKLYPTAFMASVLVGRRLFYGKKGGFSWPYP